MAEFPLNLTRNDISKIVGGDPRAIRAFEQLLKYADTALWALLDFSGSNLTDIETRNHNDLQFTRVSKSVDYQILSTDDMVLADATAAAITITLPAVSSPGVYSVKKIDASANNVTVAPLSGLIDGEATMIISQQYDCMSVVSDGTNWSIE